MECLFKKEIHVIGVQRSGIHAIVNWLIGHFNNVIYLRDASIGFCNSSYDYQYYENGSLLKKTKTLFPSDCILFDHQNVDPHCFNNLEADPAYQRSVQSTIKEMNMNLFSEKKYIILHVRDPFNNFASLYKLFGNVKKSKIEIWKKIAKYHIKQFPEFIYSNYNEWFQSEKYRQNLAKQLDLKLDERNFQKMMDNGGGSSFSKMKFQNNATQLDVFNRWKFYQNDKYYVNLFDNEILDLTNKLFNIEVKFGKKE